MRKHFVHLSDCILHSGANEEMRAGGVWAGPRTVRSPPRCFVDADYPEIPGTMEKGSVETLAKLCLCLLLGWQSNLSLMGRNMEMV